MTASWSRVSLWQAYVRNAEARLALKALAETMPDLANTWEQIAAALADVPALGASVIRLADELAASRLDGANLLAAMRAALAAHADGESDPLAYLRDEITDPERARRNRGGRA